jgi:hypothetical protein
LPRTSLIEPPKPDYLAPRPSLGNVDLGLANRPTVPGIGLQ